jgi:cyclopropane-fatty-acyl-phospholipid synthase
VSTQTRESAAETTLEIVGRLFDGYDGDFAVRLWDGTVWESSPGRPPRFTLVLTHSGSLRAMLADPRRIQLSLAKAFLGEHFDIEGDLEAVLPLADFLLKERKWGPTDQLWAARAVRALPSGNGLPDGPDGPRLQGRRDSAERLAQAVHYHYDLDPEFYGLFLDPRLVYTCAYFSSPDEDLATAQERKLDYVCRKLRLQPGERLFDIGCGWGALVMHAAQEYGVEAHGVTLSPRQAEVANERIRAAGLADRCRVEVRDYREVDGEFDKVSSIGMFEHLSESGLAEYFERVFSVLRPGGAFLNHGIGESYLKGRRRGGSFFMTYVFPDCHLMPISTASRLAEAAGFEVRDVESLREHYALTARAWRRGLEANHERAVAVAGEAVYRTWQLGMAAFAWGQDVGDLNLWQSLLVKPGPGGSSGLPLQRADWYA